MESRLLATIIIFPVWLTLVLVFHRKRQWLLYYMFGAFGLTLMMVFMAEYLGWDQIVVNVASFHVKMIAQYVLHIPINLMTNGRFELIHPDGESSILKLGIECSAILESSIIVSLIVFYPLFNFSQKILRALFGLVVTYAINIARLMIIVLMAYKFGSDYIFIAHAGVARIFFFTLELVLYWYLMTKPTVKAVGKAISNGTSVAEEATIGHAFQRRHAMAQTAVIILIIGLSLGSFAISDDWKKAFVSTPKEKRPIIYKDETAMTPFIGPLPQVTVVKPPSAVKGASTTALNQELNMDLMGGQKKEFRFDIIKEEKINLAVLSGQEDLASRFVLNGESIAFVSMGHWRFDKQNIFEPIKVRPGDVLELKFQNLADESSTYIVEVFSSKEENEENYTN